MSEENQGRDNQKCETPNESQPDCKKKRKPNPRTSVPARKRRVQNPPDLITR